MMRHALWIAALLPFSAFAQLQVFVLSGGNLTPVGSMLNVGSATVGDTIQTQFRVQNTGNQTAPLVVSLSGEGFNIACVPAPSVPAGEESAFCVDFTPQIFGSFSAVMYVNDISITLMGNATAAAAVTVSGGTGSLAAGAAVNFGSVVINQSQTQSFVLANTTNSTLTVNSVTVSGAGFSGPTGVTFPLQLGSAQSAKFSVTFMPTTDTAYQGTLSIDGRIFNLIGQGLAPALPSAALVFASTVGASAQQNSVSIPLSSAAQIAGTGTLTMTFSPSVPGVLDDPAVAFLSGPFRQATVTIAAGATVALIGGQSSMAFQTGTTAGTITFRLTIEQNPAQVFSLTIPPSTIVLDSENAVRELGSLSVSFSGFDNTYTASQLAFTFYDLSGKELPQGVINANAASAFQQYFSTTQAGGSFALLATFPVSGDTTQIGYVSAQITNSLGVTGTPQITIQN
jgi:hypothetical protein